MPGLEPAAVLNGRYRVLRPIGRGGMGAVYEAIIAGSCEVILTPGSARAAAFPPIRCALPPR